MRSMDEGELNEWLQYAEMIHLRRQRRMSEARLEEEAGGEVEGKSD